MAEMNVKLLFLAAVLLVAQTIDAVQETQGLYIFLRNESTRLVSVREIVVSPTESKTMASLSSWKVDLVQCSEDVQIVTYSTMDTVRKTFIGNMSQLMSRLVCFLNGSRDSGRVGGGSICSTCMYAGILVPAAVPADQ